MFDSSSPSSNAVFQGVWGLIFGLLNTDLVKLLIDGGQLVRRIVGERTSGLYKVSDFEHTLELCDSHGTKAIYHKGKFNDQV